MLRRSSDIDHDTCNSPRAAEKRAVFAGIGGKFVEYQGKADGQFGRKKQRIAVQGKADMAVGPEFGEQQILDVATAAIDPGDQIVGRRQRAYPTVDGGPDLRLILQHLMQNGVNGRHFVFQPVLQLVDDELAIFLLLDQALGDIPLLRWRPTDSARCPIS